MFSSSIKIQDHPLWQRLATRHRPIGFDLEVTARCNNDCRHCYINLPAKDRSAKAAELDSGEILSIASQATDMGAVWCLITGGEPLLRDDFSDIYLGLKKLGLLVNLFTNACLVTSEHTELLKANPPRDIEVSVYGASKSTYEEVTGRRGSWEAFNRGLDLLLDTGLEVRLKAMALQSNIHEFEEIARFCRERTKDFYRFDPMLHLRYDTDPTRNEKIREQRLSAREIVELEKADPVRFEALKKGCEEGDLVHPRPEGEEGGQLFRCGAGLHSFTVGYDGTFRLCSSLCHPEATYDLRSGSLHEAWEHWVSHVRGLRSSRSDFLARCSVCEIMDLCLWCPAHATLETGELDKWVEYFCEVAHARAGALGFETAGMR